MASLYDTSKTARKVVLGFLVFTAVVLVIETVTNINKDTQLAGRDPTRFYMNPDRKFSDIARPIIPGIAIDPSTNPSYGLESVFTLLPDVAYVYQVDQPREKLDDIAEAKNTVKELGFNPAIFTINENEYTWETATSTKIIKYNKEKLTWDFSTKYTDNIEAKRIKLLDTKIETYRRNVVGLVESLGFAPVGLDDGLIDARYVKYNNGSFFSNDDPLQADYVIINMFKRLPFADLKPQDELPEVTNRSLIPKALSSFVYTQDPRVGEIRVVASNKLTDFTKDVFEVSYTDYDYSVDPSLGNLPIKGSYLIITPEEAWTRVSSGQGSLVSLIPQNGNYFTEYPTSAKVIKFLADRSKTELGYYEPKEWTGYIYPIYIFKGKAEMSDNTSANFVYYMEAIKRVD